MTGTKYHTILRQFILTNTSLHLEAQYYTTAAVFKHQPQKNSILNPQQLWIKPELTVVIGTKIQPPYFGITLNSLITLII